MRGSISDYQRSNVNVSIGLGLVDVRRENRAVAGLPVEDADLGYVEINMPPVQ